MIRTHALRHTRDAHESERHRPPETLRHYADNESASRNIDPINADATRRMSGTRTSYLGERLTNLFGSHRYQRTNDR